MIKAKCKGKLLAGIVGDGIDCYVLDDDDATPVIHGRGMTAAIGAHGKGSLEQYLTRIGSESLLKSSPPMLVSLPGGGTATCYPATFLIDVCGAYDDLGDSARDDQVHMVMAARSVLRAFAKHGIESAVYTASGYHDVESREKQAAKLAMWIADETSKWSKMMNDAFTTAMCRLYGHEWSGGSPPRFLGSVQEKIYGIVCGYDVLAELQKRNPNPRHRSNHHQHLTDDAKNFFRQNIVVITALAKQSRHSEEFWLRLRAQFLDEPLQLGF
jgi:hypothetical protein